MAGPFVPESAEELREIVAEALAANQPLDIFGNGTKRGIGRLAALDAAPARGLSTAALSGVSLY